MFQIFNRKKIINTQLRVKKILREKLITEVIKMKKMLILLFFALLLSFVSTVSAQGLPQVELFDVEVNDVVKKRPLMNKYNKKQHPFFNQSMGYM